MGRSFYSVILAYAYYVELVSMSRDFDPNSGRNTLKHRSYMLSERACNDDGDIPRDTDANFEFRRALDDSIFPRSGDCLRRGEVFIGKREGEKFSRNRIPGRADDGDTVNHFANHAARGTDDEIDIDHRVRPPARGQLLEPAAGVGVAGRKIEDVRAGAAYRVDVGDRPEQATVQPGGHGDRRRRDIRRVKGNIEPPLGTTDQGHRGVGRQVQVGGHSQRTQYLPHRTGQAIGPPE